MNNSAHQIEPWITVPPLSSQWLDVMAALAVQPRYVSELQKILNLPQSTLSNRLTHMRTAGLIKCDVIPGKDVGEGKKKAVHHLYCLNRQGIKAVAEDIHAFARQVEAFTGKKKAYDA